MKNWILDCMEKGVWYTRPALVDESDVSRRLVATLVDELVRDGLLIRRRGVRADEFSLAVTSGTSVAAMVRHMAPTAPASRPTNPAVAGGPYRPKWEPLKAYETYARSHQRLCEESR